MGSIFEDRKIPPGLISDKKVKQARTEALKDLAVNDKFIYKPPEFEQQADTKVMVQKAKDPFHGPYIRNTIRHLLFERGAEFPYIPKKITIPLVAFVCTLVRIKYIRYYLFVSVFSCYSNYIKNILSAVPCNYRSERPIQPRLVSKQVQRLHPPNEALGW
jgi:hypothetical protein